MLAKSERNLEQVIAALSALQKYVRDPETEFVVREYHELLDRLDELGHEVPSGLRVPDEELTYIIYSTDGYGNVTGRSERRFVDRSRLLVRLEPALEFARTELTKQSPTDFESGSSRSATADAGRMSVERRRRRWEAMTTFDELDLMRRELRTLDEQIDLISIPPTSRERLNKWARAVEDGHLTVEDWQQMREDIEDLSSHIGANVDRDPDDYSSIAPAHQSAVFSSRVITSQMGGIEVRETTNLGKTLEAYGKRQQYRRARAAELEAVRAARVVGPAETATAVNSELPARHTPVVCLSHGHSLLWYPLERYLEKDLGLTVQAFESESHVGESSDEFLQRLVDGADCAIVLLTGDDEQPDGRERARQNVVHEIGFFQNRFGTKRVAMLIQNGVEEPSNIAGIMPIRFEGRHIDRTFYQITQWLKRENLLP